MVDNPGQPPSRIGGPAKPGGFSAAPDWSSARALFGVTAVVGILVCLLLGTHNVILPNFRDTDDATRMELVRELLGGHGWYDQAIRRFHPPAGVFLHWSRLLDGGIAGFEVVLRQAMPAAAAEYWTRFLWPLAWIFPFVAAAIAIARNLGARSAVFIAALLMLVDLNAYRQFVPGRIDHHDIQIVMATLAMACATARRSRARWAIVGGAASALGLAIGLEALPLHALIGAGYGLALLREPDQGADPARRYGLTLAGVTAALFLIQTPPGRWSLSFCDALALNLTAGVTVGGLGLAASSLAWRAGAAVRLAALAMTGAAALAVYLALDPACIHGPFAAMDPAVRPFWFDQIQEVQHLPRMLVLQRGPAIEAATLIALSVAAAAFLALRRAPKFDTAAGLLAVAVVEAAITAFFAWRMQDYVYALGLPALAAAMSWIAERRLKGLMLPTAVATLVLAPISLGLAANAAAGLAAARKPVVTSAGPRCFAGGAYRQLAALPAGNVLAPQDLGPFIVVFTHDSVVAAPYHRMSAQILAVHNVWKSPPGKAEAAVRALGADYIVDCPPYPLFVGKGTFGDALRSRPPPTWLQALSGPRATLRIYRVSPSVPPPKNNRAPRREQTDTRATID